MSVEKFEPFVLEWIAFSKNPNHNLIEKSLKLAQILEYPELDISKYVRKIDEIGNSLKLKIDNKKNPTYLISMLNEHFFEEYGFAGDDDDYYDPGNNFLNLVLDKKTGIPITLSIIYAKIASYVGLDLRIVGFPGHVIVKLDDEILQVQIAETKELRARGLSWNFEELPYDQGVLFVFDKPGTQDMWMMGMQFSIDIIWFDENFNVTHIEKNVPPCLEPIEILACSENGVSGDNAKYVLEVTAGFVDKFNISDKSVLEPISITPGMTP